MLRAKEASELEVNLGISLPEYTPHPLLDLPCAGLTSSHHYSIGIFHPRSAKGATMRTAID
jgi:hypothetical protein